MSRKFIGVIGILLVASLCIFVFGQIYQSTLPKLVEEINNSAIGAILTAFVTVLLLRGQTDGEEKRDRRIKIFEKKQDVYHEFLEKLKKIMQDGEITVAAHGSHKNADKDIDEVKDLIFQLGYIQMHTSRENTTKVFKEVAEIIRAMNEFNSTRNKKDDDKISDYYTTFSKKLFDVVAVLKSDLYEYGEEVKSIEEKEIKPILKQCGLRIQQELTDPEEMQNYFWHELQKQLKNKKYEIAAGKDFSEDIKTFYAKKGKKGVSFEFPIYTTKADKQIKFRIELEPGDNNGYYYGFPKADPKIKDAKLTDCINQIGGPSLFKEVEWWYGYKYPTSAHAINFSKLDSVVAGRLKNSITQEQLMQEITDEIHGYIQKFITKAKEANL